VWQRLMRLRAGSAVALFLTSRACLVQMYEVGHEKADAVALGVVDGGQSTKANPDEDVDAMGVASGQVSLSVACGPVSKRI
jgi:hypothetical protein